MTQKQLFLQSAEDAGIILKSNFATKVADYTKVKKFLHFLQTHNIKLGMDMSSGTCSGDVKISGFENHHILFQENDSKSLDCFKFGSLLIMCHDLTDEGSVPEMFFEAAEDSEWLTAHVSNACVYADLIDGNYIGLQFNDTKQITYDRERVDEILALEGDSQYDNDVIVPDTTHIIRNTKAGIIAYVNLQYYKGRAAGGTLVYKLKNHSMDSFVGLLSKNYSIL